MISRTESLSAGAAGAPAETIVKTVVKAFHPTFAAFFAGWFRRRRGVAEVVALSDHELRDIGAEHWSPEHRRQGDPIAYDLLDLMPRGTFSHRNQR